MSLTIYARMDKNGFTSFSAIGIIFSFFFFVSHLCQSTFSNSVSACINFEERKIYVN